MKNIPFTKILLEADYGHAGFTGTGLAAEYDILSRKLVWRKANQQSMESVQKAVVALVLGGRRISLISYF